MRVTPSKIKAVFGFSKLPFAKESIDIFEHKRFTKALESLEYLAERAGIGCLTAPPGSGKSVLISTFLENLSKTAYFPVYITHTTCSTLDLYRQILYGFGIEPVSRKSEMFRRLQDRLSDLAIGKRIRPIMIIDEAHRLAPAFFEEIRLFTNFECDRRDEMVVLLAGQPLLAQRLRLAVNEPLSQRIIVRATLKSLTAAETINYVNHRLKVVGRTAELFTPCGFEALYKASRGVPRVVDQIAERSILHAVKKKAKTIDAQIVSKVAIESDF